MAFLVLPIMVVLFFIGIGAQMGQLAQAVPGAGRSGLMDNAAAIASQRMKTFGAACLDAATASPGMISANVTVTMPLGVVAPAGAVCVTTAAGSGVRNVFGYANSVNGEAAQLVLDTQGSAAWYLVQSQGQAVNVALQQIVAVPPTIPAGAMLEWVQIKP